MPDSLGTRSKQSFCQLHIDGRSETRSHSADLGMSKRVVTTATFGSGNITGSNGDFANFAIGDPLLVQETNLNNGYFDVTAIDGTNHAFVTVDPPPKTEGPIASTIVRTA